MSLSVSRHRSRLLIFRLHLLDSRISLPISPAELIRNGSILKSSVHCVGLQSSGAVTFEDMAKSPMKIMKLYYEMMEPTKEALVSLTKGEPLTDAFGDSIPSLPALKAIIASPFIFFGPPIAKELKLHWTTLIDTSTAGSVVTLRIAEEACKVQDPEAMLCQEGVKLPGFADFKTHELIKVFGETQLTGNSPTVSLQFKRVAWTVFEETRLPNFQPSFTHLSHRLPVPCIHSCLTNPGRTCERIPWPDPKLRFDSSQYI